METPRPDDEPVHLRFTAPDMPTIEGSLKSASPAGVHGVFEDLGPFAKAKGLEGDLAFLSRGEGTGMPGSGPSIEEVGSVPAVLTKDAGSGHLVFRFVMPPGEPCMVPLWLRRILGVRGSVRVPVTAEDGVDVRVTIPGIQRPVIGEVQDISQAGIGLAVRLEAGQAPASGAELHVDLSLGKGAPPKRLRAWARHARTVGQTTYLGLEFDFSAEPPAGAFRTTLKGFLDKKAATLQST